MPLKKFKFFHNLQTFIFISLFLIINIADQLTKHIFEKKFLIQQSTNSIHNYFAHSQTVFKIGQENWLHFSLTYVRNTGAAWGLLGNLPESIRPYFFYIITALAMLFVIYLFFITNKNHTVSRLGIVFIFSGAMGNYLDRIRLNYVIDWIHFDWKIFFWQYDYPVFNIADCCVTIGVILLIIDTFRKK